MLASDYATPGNPLPGSVDWGAARILRLLEEEERRRQMAWADGARHPARPQNSSVPAAMPLPLPGSDAWGAMEFERLLNDGSGAVFPSLSSGDGPGTAPGGAGIARAWIGQPRAGIPEDELFLTPRDVVDLGISMIPVVGDAYGLYRDIEAYIDDPESRTWTNYGLTAAGMLPFVPGGMTKIIRKGGEKLEDILNANPRTKIDEIPADATGRLGKPITRETVIRVADAFQQRFDNIEPGRFKLIAGGGRQERAIQPPGYDGYEGKRLAAGAQFGDIMFLDTKTGRQFIIQVARVNADGRPIAEELDNALRIARMPTRIPRPYRKDEKLMGLDLHPQHTVIVVTPPSDW